MRGFRFTEWAGQGVLVPARERDEYLPILSMEPPEASALGFDLLSEEVRRGGVFDFVKVLDFGLVKERGLGRESEISGTAGVIGTPAYMAPEGIVLRCLAKDRADRPASASALCDELAPIAQSLPAWTDREADEWWRAHVAELAALEARRRGGDEAR